MQHDGAERHGSHLVAAKVLGRGEGQDDGQEVERGVADHHEHAIGAGGRVDQAAEEQAQQDRLGDTAGHQCGERRYEHVGAQVDDHAHEVLLLGRQIVCVGVDGTAVGHARHLQELLVCFVHGAGADDDLVLARIEHAALGELGGVHGLLVDEARILEVEAQARNAVIDARDVVDTSDVFQNDLEVVLVLHGPFLPLECS